MTVTDRDPDRLAAPEAPRPLVYICGLDPDVHTNGHVTYVQAHALAAAAAGFSPHIFCVGVESSVEGGDYGVLHRVATPVRHYFLAPTYRRPIAQAVAAYLEGCGHEPPHLIHSFGPWAATSASAAAELARRGIATVTVANAYTTIVHEWAGMRRALRVHPGLRVALRYLAWTPWVRTVADRSERHGYQRAHIVLVNYDSVAELLRAACGPGLRIRRLPYASPSAFRAQTSSPVPVPGAVRDLAGPEAPLILSVSRHVPRKGLYTLLRALAALHAEGVAFRACLVGPGRLLAEHRAMVASLGLSGRVAIPGLVSDVRPYLHAADVFVLPSLEEGSGSISLLEALQAGTAIVASACDGISEDIVDGEHGLLVRPGDERALAGALARVLVDGGLRGRLAANARRLYLERFAPEPFTAALRDTYAELGFTP